MCCRRQSRCRVNNDPQTEYSRVVDLRALVRAIIAALEERYGHPELNPHGDVLTELVATVLSQNTSDTNADRAFEALRQTYADWDSLAAASEEDIAAVIRPSGLSRQKAATIKRVVCTFLACGIESCTERLRHAPLDEAVAWLTRIPGVGRKTAACALLFALGRPALPVDTHVFRVSRRLGLVPERVSVDVAHRLLAAIVPPEDVYRFHVLLIRHGRTICVARRPRCETCPLTAWCRFYRSHQREEGMFEEGASTAGPSMPPGWEARRSSGWTPTAGVRYSSDRSSAR